MFTRNSHTHTHIYTQSADRDRSHACEHDGLINKIHPTGKHSPGTITRRHSKQCVCVWSVCACVMSSVSRLETPLQELNAQTRPPSAQSLTQFASTSQVLPSGSRRWNYHPVSAQENGAFHSHWSFQDASRLLELQTLSFCGYLLIYHLDSFLWPLCFVLFFFNLCCAD